MIAAPDTLAEVLNEKNGMPYWTVPKALEVFDSVSSGCPICEYVNVNGSVI